MKKHGLLLLMVFVWTLFALAGLAFAADNIEATAAMLTPQPAPTTWAVILQQYVIPTVAGLILGLISLGIRWLGRKFKIEALATENNFLEQLAHQGITLAEERAAQLAGSKASLTGTSKLAIATGHVLSIMPKASEARVQSVIEALLAQIPGVGATGETAITAPGGGIGVLGQLATIPPDASAKTAADTGTDQ